MMPIINTPGLKEGLKQFTLTWYITDRDTYVSRLKEVGMVYREIMGKNYPAMTCIVVQALVEEQALIEIEVTAVKPD